MIGFAAGILVGAVGMILVLGVLNTAKRAEG